jgi:predicted O-methyltransferase YrrM
MLSPRRGSGRSLRLMLSDWQEYTTDAQKERVRKLGLLTGLSYEKGRGFRPANFERALVLQRLVALTQPKTVLELGTGRGLGALALADAAREHRLECEVTSVDIIPPTDRQWWPIEVDGEQKELRTSIDEIWGKHIDEDLRQCIRLRTGKTTSVLPAMAREGREFDLIFIDAGHDLFSVIHDLSYSAVLLSRDGVILMDDFAPLEEFGLGICVAVSNARRWFNQVETFTTEGLVYGGVVCPDAPRGMVLLRVPCESRPRVRRSMLAWWRFAGAILERCYRPAFSPLSR